MYSKKCCKHCSQRNGEPIEISSKFCFEDPLVWIGVPNPVQQRLYRVHRAEIKRESPILKKILDGQPDSGSNKRDPLLLSDHIECTCEEFETFLTYVYEGDASFVRDSVYDYLDLVKTFKQFECGNAITTILNRFQSAASSVGPFEQLKLANEHGFSLLKLKAFTTLACRALMLSDEEAEGMSKSDILQLARIRERLFVDKGGLGDELTEKLDEALIGCRLDERVTYPVFFSTDDAEKAVVDVLPFLAEATFPTSMAELKPVDDVALTVQPEGLDIDCCALPPTVSESSDGTFSFDNCCDAPEAPAESSKDDSYQIKDTWDSGWGSLKSR